MQKHRSIKGDIRRNVSGRKQGSTEIGMVDAGFTLIELMIALMILTFGILGIWSMQGTAVRGNAQAKHVTEIAALASDQVEKLMRLEYDDADLAQGNHTRSEDPYTVDWVVSAGNTPINNVKTVTVTAYWAVDGQTRNRVSYVYYKADQM